MLFIASQALLARVLDSWLRCDPEDLGCNRKADQTDVDLLWLLMGHNFGFSELCLGNTMGFHTYLSSSHRLFDDLVDVAPILLMIIRRL